jgi:hypothetical protein
VELSSQLNAIPWGGAMKVRDLRALLAKLDKADLDPDDTVIFDSATRSVTVVRVRPGMHQPVGDPELSLTDEDKEFLRALRIPS